MDLSKAKSGKMARAMQAWGKRKHAQALEALDRAHKNPRGAQACERWHREKLIQNAARLTDLKGEK